MRYDNRFLIFLAQAERSDGPSLTRFEWQQAGCPVYADFICKAWRLH